jgi:hypothetical protein
MDQQVIEKGHSKINQWRGDWVLAAHEIFGIVLDSEQKEIIRDAQIHQRLGVASGTSRGKDFVAAVAALLFLYLTPRWNSKGELEENTKVFCIAPTDRQIKNIMYPEITKLISKAKARGVDLPGEQVAYDIRMKDYREWFLTGFKADNTSVEAWTGLHAVNIMFIITEATGIEQLIWDSLEGNMQGNSKMMILYNHNITSGFAAQTQKTKRWKTHRLNSLNAPNVKSKKILIPGQVDYVWVKDKLETWCEIIDPSQVSEMENDFVFEGVAYRPNDRFRVKVLGLFPKVDSDVLIPGQWIEKAFERWEKMQGKYMLHEMWGEMLETDFYKRKYQNRIGADVAGMGRDNSSFVERYGPYVDKFTILHGRGEFVHMQVAGNIVNLMKQSYDTFRGRHPQAFIDTIGEGAGVFSRLLEMVNDPNTADLKAILENSVFSVKFSEKAEHNGNILTDRTGEYKFLNMRAYCYWALRDYFDPNNPVKAMVPYNEKLYAQLTQTLWFFRSDGRIQIEDKEDIVERIGHSPDEADSLAVTFDPQEDQNKMVGQKSNIQKFKNIFH